jgi:hypothetical protein
VISVAGLDVDFGSTSACKQCDLLCCVVDATVCVQDPPAVSAVFGAARQVLG